MLRRLLESVAAALGLLVCSPLLLCIAICIVANDGGSVFYRQERLGRGGRTFSLIKFRTMIASAESGIPQLAVEADWRVTRCGRFLRRYHLDELPQLWNVLRGDMSLIGPRPERAYYVRQIVERMPLYRELQSQKPGLTSLGMVRYGYANTVEKMVERARYDLYYLRRRNLCLDLKILADTLREVWKGRGI